MIMTGHPSRTLGQGGVLTALGCALVLLPFNPTWGQKPPEPPKVEVVGNEKPATATVEFDFDGDGDLDLFVVSDEPQAQEARTADIRVIRKDDETLAELTKIVNELARLRKLPDEGDTRAEAGKGSKPPAASREAVARRLSLEARLSEVEQDLTKRKQKLEATRRVVRNSNDPALRSQLEKLKSFVVYRDQLADQIGKGQGPVIADIETARGEVAQAERDRKRAEERLAWTLEMNKKGYVSESMVKSETLALQKANAAAEQAQAKQDVVVRFTREQDPKGKTPESGDLSYNRQQGAIARKKLAEKQEAMKAAEADGQDRVVIVRERHADEQEAKKAAEADGDEASADQDKLKAELGELHAQVQSAGKQMAEARQRLAEAQKKLAEANLKLRQKARQSANEAKLIEYKLRLDRVPSNSTNVKPSDNMAGKLGSLTQKSNPDQEKRIAELEKKLDKVLGELESLKKGGKN